MITYLFQDNYICDTDSDRTANVALFEVGCKVFVKDTGIEYIYKGSGEFWAVTQQQRIIGDLSDFPAPVSGVITLEDNITYRITGTVDIGTNRFECGIQNTFYGVDKQNDILTSSTTGTMFTLDSTSTDKGALTFDTMKVVCTSGTVFNVTSTSQRNVIVLNNINIIGFTSLGTVNNNRSFVVRNCAFLTGSSSGLTFTGANGTLQIRDSQVRTVTGTFLALGASTFNNISISRNLIATVGGETFLSGTTGGANVTIGGLIDNNIYSGAGTFVSTITAQDANWLFTDNIGVTDTLITNAELANTAVANLSGTNTGDNATNSQYSGLAASKQDTLVSGTNIKTINGDSVLGSGDLVVTGGGVSVTNTTVAVPYSNLFYKATVVDAGVSTSSKIVILNGDYAMTDENCADGINFWVVAGTGQFDLYLSASNNNKFGGNLKFKYFL